MEIIAVMGYLCSGKSTYAQQYPDAFSKIEVSDIVRRLTKTEKRVHDSNLDTAIIGELHSVIMEASDSGQAGIVVTGIRQRSILMYLESMCDTMEELELKRIWLDVPYEILRHRYYKRGAEKDNGITYDQVMERDNQLGLKNLVEYLKIVNTFTVQNYTKHEI
jgi:predicted kinase